MIKPKRCPHCNSFVARGATTCPKCSASVKGRPKAHQYREGQVSDFDVEMLAEMTPDERRSFLKRSKVLRKSNPSSIPARCAHCNSFVARTATSCPKCSAPVRGGKKARRTRKSNPDLPVGTRFVANRRIEAQSVVNGRAAGPADLYEGEKYVVEKVTGDKVLLRIDTFPPMPARLLVPAAVLSGVRIQNPGCGRRSNPSSALDNYIANGRC